MDLHWGSFVLGILFGFLATISGIAITEVIKNRIWP